MLAIADSIEWDGQNFKEVEAWLRDRGFQSEHFKVRYIAQYTSLHISIDICDVYVVQLFQRLFVISGELCLTKKTGIIAGSDISTKFIIV